MRKLSLKELKKIIAEEFKDQDRPEELTLQQKHWYDADLENEIDWQKALKIKEIFAKATKGKE